ncbi:MAG: DNA polymerase III subunit gamma/tau [Phycisphaerae bacterium]|nr:DNA polymerase III subunit gamma/tau [Phycisphaerae bacterium]
MSYTVLARRYRSKDFDDLVGQEPIARTLKNAIETNRVAHAYLFCGTRGVGKTSTARILAKALNCEKGPTPKPCGTCDRCKAIAAGEDIDVIEIDGASNRGIDDIKTLRSNAIYRPARSPYKIYIIDEVHQLSKDAFNALLKTLEEPPSHVKFIFATTESHKVPQTILSRCQEFHFRLIPTQEIAARLTEILKAEKIQASDEVVLRVARAGRGSMRDALSLMDQLLAMGAEKVTEEQVDYLLGEPAADQMIALADAFAGGKPADALARTDQLLASGFAPEQFVVSLIEHLRRLMLLGVVGPDCSFLDVASGERARLAQQAGRFNPMTLVYLIEVLEQLRQSVRQTTTAARALIDAAMVRLALLDQFADTADLLDRMESGGGRGSPPPGAVSPSVGDDAKKKPSAAVAPVSPAAAAPIAAKPPAEGQSAPVPNGDLGPPIVPMGTDLEAVAGDDLWKQILARMNQPGLLILSGPLMLASLVGAEGNTLKLSAQPTIVRLLSDPRRQGQLCSVLSRLLDRTIDVQWIEQEAQSAPARGGTAAAGPARANGGLSPEAAGQSAPPGAMPAQRLSQKEVEQIIADPMIRQMMDMFNAQPVSVERRPGGESRP